MMKTVLLFIICLTLIACEAEKKTDASSEQNMQKSIVEIMKDLSAEDQEQFEKSLKIIMLNGMDNITDMVALEQNMSVAKGIFQGRVDGKSANEVIFIARSIVADRWHTNDPKAGIPLSAEEFLEDTGYNNHSTNRSSEAVTVDDFLKSR